MRGFQVPNGAYHSMLLPTKWHTRTAQLNTTGAAGQSGGKMLSLSAARPPRTLTRLNHHRTHRVLNRQSQTMPAAVTKMFDANVTVHSLAELWDVFSFFPIVI